MTRTLAVALVIALVAAAPAAAQDACAPLPQRDSLKNGALIGAIAGAAAGAVGGWALASLFENEGRGGAGPFVYVMSLGAGGGAAVGAGIDALINRRDPACRKAADPAAVSAYRFREGTIVPTVEWRATATASRRSRSASPARW